MAKETVPHSDQGKARPAPKARTHRKPPQGPVDHAREWATALQAHPIFTADIATCHAACKKDTRGSLDPDDLTTCVDALLRRYAPAWDASPNIPNWAIKIALARAIQAGTWARGIRYLVEPWSVTRTDGEYHSLGRSPEAASMKAALRTEVGFYPNPLPWGRETIIPTMVFRDAYLRIHSGDGVLITGTVIPPVADQETPLQMAVLLLLSANSDKKAAVDALKGAWDREVAPYQMLEPGGLASGGNAGTMDYGRHMRLYRLWLSWTKRRIDAAHASFAYALEIAREGSRLHNAALTIWPKGLPSRRAITQLLGGACRWLDPVCPLDLPGATSVQND